LVLLIFVGATAYSSAGLAQTTRLGVFGSIGMGGEAEADLDLENAADLDDSQDLDATFGAGLSYDAAVAKILSLGALFRFYQWSTDNYSWETGGDNRGLGLDIAFLPRLRFPARKLEIYFAVPVGLSVASKDDNRTFLIVDSAYKMGLGHNLGFFGGVQFPIDRDMALFGELGWQSRSITHTASAEADSDAEAELTYATGQVTLNAGFVFF
jgi:hypothetical protein